MRPHVLLVALVPLLACSNDRGPSAPVASAAPPASVAASPTAMSNANAKPLFPPPPTSIGTASMLPDGTIVISSPHMVSRTAPSDPNYAATLKHLGGLKPGEQKNAPPWPDDFDAARVETVVRAYLTLKGLDPNQCRGEIMGSSKDSVITSVVCGDKGLGLKLTLPSYDVVESDHPKSP